MTNRSIALFPGSFDPPTNGHLDIIRRSAGLYDKLYVVVAENVAKHYLFTTDERKHMLEAMVKSLGKVEVVVYSGPVVQFAMEHDVGVIIRGVRAISDFNYEFELALYYKQIDPEVEVLFMPTSPQYFMVRSSAIREMASFGLDVAAMVPPLVARALKKKNRKKA